MASGEKREQGQTGNTSLSSGSQWSSPFEEVHGPGEADVYTVVSPLTIPEEAPKSLYLEFKEKFADCCIDADRLEPVKELGVGGFAVVTLCRLKKDDGSVEQVAVKRLKRDFLTSHREVAVFVAETQLLGKLCHPNIVAFEGVCAGVAGGGQGEASISLVQECLNHGSLKDLVLKKYMSPSSGVYSKRQGLQWLLEVARGLAYLHGLNITVIHRDLKLENILLHQREESGPIVAKITDFGLSAMVRKPKVRGPGLNKESINSKGLGRRVSGNLKRLGSNLMKQFSTVGEILEAKGDPNRSTGNLYKTLSLRPSKDIDTPLHNLSGRTGSLLYMAPEVILCKQYNEKVDVFSFAICMYEVLCGAWLLGKVMGSTTDSRDVEKYAEKVAGGYRNPVSAFWPSELKKLVEECWAQEANDRPAMRQVVERLQAMYDSGMFDNEEDMDEEAKRCCSLQ
ncbi:hypothetical protein BSKO_07464 [Bryopsis sp. KO-2023]|nr:hypothetical protein BSKO_07464 [Bryopsis sp. KO-2023]